MKKVLLSSVAALAVFSAAAPAFASDNSYSSNALIQKHYVSERDLADEANTQVAKHEAETTLTTLKLSLKMVVKLTSMLVVTKITLMLSHQKTQQ